MTSLLQDDIGTTILASIPMFSLIFAAWNEPAVSISVGSQSYPKFIWGLARQRVCSSQRRVIADRHAAGTTIAELAREYECGEATIWRAMRAPA
jgi:hypothetical protein